MTQPVWSTDGATKWWADDDRYHYAITPSNIAEFQGFISRKSGADQHMVFSWSYSSLAAARSDLLRRGQAEYFVRPDDPTYQPPTATPIPAEERPMEDTSTEPEGYPPYVPEPVPEPVVPTQDQPAIFDVEEDGTLTPTNFEPAPPEEVDFVTSEEEDAIADPVEDTSTPETDDLVPTGQQFFNHIVTLYLDKKNEYRWNRRAANGKIISESAESYPERRKCLHGIALANQDTNYRIRDRAKALGK